MEDAPATTSPYPSDTEIRPREALHVPGLEALLEDLRKLVKQHGTRSQPVRDFILAKSATIPGFKDRALALLFFCEASS